MKQFVICLFDYVISCLFVNISSYLFTEADCDTRGHRPHNCFIHFRPAPSCFKLKTENVKMIQKRPWNPAKWLRRNLFPKETCKFVWTKQLHMCWLDVFRHGTCNWPQLTLPWITGVYHFCILQINVRKQQTPYVNMNAIYICMNTCGQEAECRRVTTKMKTLQPSLLACQCAWQADTELLNSSAFFSFLVFSETPQTKTPSACHVVEELSFCHHAEILWTSSPLLNAPWRPNTITSAHRNETGEGQGPGQGQGAPGGSRGGKAQCVFAVGVKIDNYGSVTSRLAGRFDVITALWSTVISSQDGVVPRMRRVIQ